jgi:hypothetical protein
MDKLKAVIDVCTKCGKEICDLGKENNTITFFCKKCNYCWIKVI